ncbi:MAG: EexN family lipoprotein [Burkholderiaceae bacterium]|jgi:hypothetical protein|nr:EexN family lipoprotein [Burkholderiaceae bacterium]
MKQIMLALAVFLAACGPSQPTDTVESLVANPERIKEIQRLCKEDRAKVGDELCRRAAEATNRLFFGDGKTPYTPSKEPPKF